MTRSRSIYLGMTKTTTDCGASFRLTASALYRFFNSMWPTRVATLIVSQDAAHAQCAACEVVDTVARIVSQSLNLSNQEKHYLACSFTLAIEHPTMRAPSRKFLGSGQEQRKKPECPGPLHRSPIPRRTRNSHVRSELRPFVRSVLIHPSSRLFRSSDSFFSPATRT